MSKQNKILMRDIAHATGYSINTVSHALKDKSDVSVKTREYIKQTAADMGYIVDSVASSLRSGITRTIAVIIGDIFNPHFGLWVKDIELTAFNNGYSTFIINTNEDTELEKNAIIAAISKRVDGIMICPTQKSIKNIEIIKKANIPFVLIGRRYAGYNYVVCDDVKGGEIATNYLISQHCVNILFLNGPAYISSANERLEGYKKALGDSKIPYAEELVKTVDIKMGGLKNVISEIIGGIIRFDGIFAFSDILAFEVMTELGRYGDRYTRIPIVGFDNIMEKLVLPISIATISVKGKSIASIAFNELTNLMVSSNENMKTVEIISDVELVIY